MSEPKDTRRMAFKVGLLQFVLLAASGLIFLLNQSAMTSAALAGAAIGLSGSSAFALISLSPGNGRSAGAMLFSVYVGQASKYFIILAGLIMAYSVLPEIDRHRNVLALLAGVLLSQCAYLVAPYLRARSTG